jgi:hypothetical protein
MRVFIGGIMQGSRGNGIEAQDYRGQITEILRARWPDVEIIDPFVLHPNSVTYDDNIARETLFSLAELAAASDVLVVYLPQASMGTALEMYMAYQQGVPVLAITPLVENWVVRAMARHIFPDLAAFQAFITQTERLDA